MEPVRGGCGGGGGCGEGAPVADAAPHGGVAVAAGEHCPHTLAALIEGVRGFGCKKGNALVIELE